MPNEGSVRIAPDSTGQAIRNLTITTVVPDTNGNPQVVTVDMQVISIADGQGNVVAIDDLASLALQVRMLKMLRRIAGALESGMELGVNMASEAEGEDVEDEL